MAAMAFHETRLQTDQRDGDVQYGNPLVAEFGLVDDSASPPLVGWWIHPAFGEQFLSFECGGTAVSVTGSVIAGMTPVNKMAAAFKLAFSGYSGIQKPEALEGGEKRFLTLETVNATEQAGLTMADSISNERLLESEPPTDRACRPGGDSSGSSARRHHRCGKKGARTSPWREKVTECLALKSIEGDLMKRFLPRPTYANVVSTLCLFLLLGGASAFAATQLAKNSVGSKQIKKNAVVTAKIKNAAVTNSKLGDGAVTSGKLADAAVATSKLANNAVTSGKITDAAVTISKLANDAVTSAKIADGEVHAADLGTILEVQNTVQINAGAEGTADVACPAGSVLLSGGGYWTTGANNLRTTLKQGNGWRVEGKNTLGGSAPLTVQAYCLSG
jgi:hypothetical protein